MSRKKGSSRRPARWLRRSVPALAAFLGIAHATGFSPSFYEGKGEGWFWYNETLEPEPETPEEKTPSELPKSPPVGSAVPPFSAAWLKKNLPKYLERAVDNPTPENVAAFFALQRLAMDKAERFAKTAQKIPALYPALDENVRRPLASFASRKAEMLADEGMDRALKKIASRVGIFFFFRSDCPYCHIQAPILKTLQDLYGFKVIAVSLDGMPMPNGLYQNFRVDQGQAAVLGVTMTPALFLVNPGDSNVKIRPIGEGALALDQLKRRILETAHDAGWLDDKTYENALPVRPLYMVVPESGRQPESPREILKILGLERSNRDVSQIEF